MPFNAQFGTFNWTSKGLDVAEQISDCRKELMLRSPRFEAREIHKYLGPADG
jgi:hypothetical protein